MRAPNWIIVCIAIVTTSAPAIAGIAPSSESAPPNSASAENLDLPDDCTPHPPILIQEDVGPLGFEWDNPATDEREYRPGSGVVAGSGTSEDPYIVEGWCIVGESLLRQLGYSFFISGSAADGSESGSGVALEGTSAHVVVRDNTILGGSTAEPNLQALNPVGVHVDEARNVAVENNDIDGFLRGVIIQESDDTVALRGNTVTGNTAQDIVLERSSGVTLAENQMGPHGIDFDRMDGRGAVANLQHILHDIDASNTVNGEPVRHIADASDVTIAGEAGQVIIAASTGVLVDGVDIPHNATTLVAFSEDVVIRNSTLTVVNLGAPGSVVENNTLSTLLVKSESSNTMVRGNVFQRSSFIGIGSADNTVQENTITDSKHVRTINLEGPGNTIKGNSIADGTGNAIRVGWSGNTIEGNTIADHEGSGVVLVGPNNSVENNTIIKNTEGIHSLGDSQRIVGNTISNNSDVGVNVGVSDHHLVRDNTITENGDHGVRTTVTWLGDRSKFVTYEENTIAHNERAGIYFRKAEHNDVQNNVIHDNGLSGIRVQDSGDTVVRGNTLRDNGLDGLRLHSPDAVEVLTDEDGGSISPLPGDVNPRDPDSYTKHNYDFHTGPGSYLHTVEHNNVTGNERHGISVDYSFGDRINHNNIWNNEGHGVFADNTQGVDALHNWWGCTEGPEDPSCDDTEGSVYYHEWLTGPLPEAGAPEA